MIYSDGRCFMCGRIATGEEPQPLSVRQATKFGAVVKEYRQEHNMTQLQLAAKLGVPAGYISYWENFDRSPRNEEELLNKLYSDSDGDVDG